MCMVLSIAEVENENLACSLSVSMTSLSTLVGLGGSRGMGRLLDEDTCTSNFTFPD